MSGNSVHMHALPHSLADTCLGEQSPEEVGRKLESIHRNRSGP